MKIAILECDEVLAKLQPRFGQYSDMIQRLLALGEGEFAFEVFDCTRQHYPDDPTAFDLFITTGSKASAYWDEPWIQRLIEFVRQLDKLGCKLVGICFGHQIIALALGGRVERSPRGWGIGIAHNRVVTRPAWMGEYKRQLDLIVSHQDQVTQLPTGAEVIAESDFCPYFMVQWNDHFLSIQGHPEWNNDYSRALIEERRDRFPAELVECALESLQGQPDNRLFARWILDFATARHGNGNGG